MKNALYRLLHWFSHSVVGALLALGAWQATAATSQQLTQAQLESAYASADCGAGCVDARITQYRNQLVRPARTPVHAKEDGRKSLWVDVSAWHIVLGDDKRDQYEFGFDENATSLNSDRVLTFGVHVGRHLALTATYANNFVVDQDDRFAPRVLDYEGELSTVGVQWSPVAYAHSHGGRKQGSEHRLVLGAEWVSLAHKLRRTVKVNAAGQPVSVPPYPVDELLAGSSVQVGYQWLAYAPKGDPAFSVKAGISQGLLRREKMNGVRVSDDEDTHYKYDTVYLGFGLHF